jgi:hypothetical protein
MFDDDEGHPGGFCYARAHTTDPAEVDYYDEYSGEGNKNVCTCDEKGCSKKKKRKVVQGAERSLKKKKVSCHEFRYLLLLPTTFFVQVTA